MLGSNLRKAKENAYLKVLMGIEMFATLSTSERTLLLKKFKEVAYSEGEVIVQQGEVERNFYILMRGTANVHLRNKPADGESEIPGFLSLDSQKKVTTLQAGAYFGEDALLKDVPRTATIVAGKRATCFVLTSAAFLSIVGSPKDYSSRNEVHRNELVMITGQSMERKIPKKELVEITELGTGTFSTVQLVQHEDPETNKTTMYALKMMRSEQFEQKQREAMSLEVKIMKMLDHPFVLKLVCEYEDSGNLGLLLEFVKFYTTIW